MSHKQTKSYQYNKRLDAIFDTYNAQELKKANCPHSVQLKHHMGYQCPTCYQIITN